MRGVDLSERYLTAVHEAGHAVAAVQRGGTFDAVSIEPTLGRDGVIHVEHRRCHRDFVTFAGPWAEARADWGELPLDGVDGRGHTFHDYLRASMRSNASDLRGYVPEQDIPSELWYAEFGWNEGPEIPLAREESWYTELETCWPTIQWAADMLLSQAEVTPEAVARRLRNGAK